MEDFEENKFSDQNEIQNTEQNEEALMIKKEDSNEALKS